MSRSSQRQSNRSGDSKPRSQLQPGDMIIYPFLWTWENKKGQAAAYKMRPCMIVSRVSTDEGELVAILPITTRPRPDLKSIPIPEQECRRTGSSTKVASHVSLADMNIDRLDEPSFIRLRNPCRSYSPEFVKEVREQFAECAKNRLIQHNVRKAEAVRDVQMDFIV